MKRKIYIENRVRRVVNHIILTGDTVRRTAELLDIDKSTVHLDITVRAKKLGMVTEVEHIESIMKDNLANRHIRGGIATKEKWRKIMEVR